MKRKGFVIIFTMIVLILFIPIFPNELKFTKADSEYDTSGVFSLTNTTDWEKLVFTPGSLVHIGTTWNLTVHVFENSTTAINITYQNNYILSPDWWEGRQSIIMFPNETHTEIYTSHVTGDTPLGLAFYFSLINSSKYVNGQYFLSLVHLGYPCDVGTSHLFVSNITAWLESLSSTTTSSSTESKNITTTSQSSPSTSINSNTWGFEVLGIVCASIIVATIRRKNRL